MKKIILYPLFALCCIISAHVCKAQNIVNSANENNPMSAFQATHTRDTRPAVLPMPRYDDVVWSKKVWRKVDFKKEFNQFFYYPVNAYAGDAQVGLRSFTDILWTAVQNGTITAYGNDHFDVPLTPDEVQKKFKKERIQTRTEVNDEGYEVDRTDTIRKEFEMENVTAMEIAEIWYIDKQRSEQAVRIFGFSLIVEDKRIDEETGEEIPDGERDVFWIDYNEPAVRQLLASEEVYNEVNDAYRRSFDDIFIQRYFDSYIYKESNVQDRRFGNYSVGIDALLKAEDAKKEIMDREIDMWEY